MPEISWQVAGQSVKDKAGLASERGNRGGLFIKIKICLKSN